MSSGGFEMLVIFIGMILIFSTIPVYLLRNRFASREQKILWGIVFFIAPLISVVVFMPLNPKQSPQQA